MSTDQPFGPRSGESLKKNPASKVPYRYHALAASDIRLLILLPGQDSDQVHCHLIHVSLASRPKYETISYAWGSPLEKRTIDCEGKTIEVTVNLYSAFRHIRHTSEERIIWADAVCIDQENITERSQQVLLMGDVYSQAEQVLVWLGEETEDVSKWVEIIEDFNTYFLEHEVGYPNDPERWHTVPDGQSSIYLDVLKNGKEWMGPIGALVSRPWFIRRWVIQEVAKSPRATVVCGKKQIAWTMLADVVWNLMKANMLDDFGLLQDPGPIIDGFQSILVIELVRRDAESGQKTNLLELIVSTRMYHCLDRRDVLFSLFGVVGDLDSYNKEISFDNSSTLQELDIEREITPNYESTVEEVYINLVIACISKKKSLLPLSATYIKPEIPDLDLPSWVPDFSRLSNTSVLMYLRNEAALPYQASGDTKLIVRFSNDYKTLYARGKIVDAIKEVAIALDEVQLPSTDAPLSPKQLTMRKLSVYYDRCRQVAFSGGDDSALSPRFDEFARTLTCNVTGSGGFLPEDFTQMFQLYLDVITNADEAFQKYNGAENLQGYINKILFMDSAIARAIRWRLCRTQDGRLGRVLKSIKEGDLVCILYGGEVPYILRPCGDGQYEFLGSCYIHGLMNGEAIRMEGLEEREFSIC